jgi:hypothetical protein
VYIHELGIAHPMLFLSNAQAPVWAYGPPLPAPFPAGSYEQKQLAIGEKKLQENKGSTKSEVQ